MAERKFDKHINLSATFALKIHKKINGRKYSPMTKYTGLAYNNDKPKESHKILLFLSVDLNLFQP